MLFRRKDDGGVLCLATGSKLPQLPGGDGHASVTLDTYEHLIKGVDAVAAAANTQGQGHMTDDHTEMHLRVDTANSIFMALVFAAATKHPNWEADRIGGYVIRLGSTPGPRSISGLERWFLANYPDAAHAITARINAGYRSH